MSKLKRALLVLLSLIMIGIGVDHFANPEPFVRIVPAFLPAPLLLVYVSGFFEIAGGAGLLILKTRRVAALGLCALYVAVFPANINMAIHEIQLSSDAPLPIWMLWARLPLQLVFIAWAYWLSVKSQPKSAG